MPWRSTHSTAITTIAAVILSTLIFGISACGRNDAEDQPKLATQTARNGDVFNDADIDFATAFIQHHAAALALVDLTSDHQLSAESTQLADDILSTRGSEVEQLATWLTEWGHPIPDTMRDHVNAGHSDSGHGDPPDEIEFSGDVGSGLPGMPSVEALNALVTAEDSAFETKWLELLAAHHRGALKLAKTEEDDGRFPAAVTLARAITKAQQSELDRIDQLLDE